MNTDTEKQNANVQHSEILTMFNNYQPLVISLARKYMGNGAEFDDLIQEGRLILWQLLTAYKADTDGPLGLYLWRRMRYRVRDRAEQLRRSYVRPLDFIGEVHAPCFSSAGFALAELRASIHDPVDVVVLRLIGEGRTQAEIAEYLHMSQQAVSKRLKKIRALL